MKNNFWDDQNRVKSFAAKAADHRLVELVKQYPVPSEIKVLDLGCAAGRNTIFLAECGFDIWAVDSSKAMIKETQESLTTLLNADEISNRIKTGKMENLSWAKDGCFDLIIALGIYHNARSEKEFENAISETHRVLKPGGKLLVANFAPGTELPDINLVKDFGPIWKDENFGNLYLLTGTELDKRLEEHSLFPFTKTITVVKKIANGKRVTVNALYEKRQGKKGP